MGSQNNNNSKFFPLILLLCALLVGAGAGLYVSTLGTWSQGWPLIALVTLVAFVMGLTLIWRHRWVYWLCSGGSLLSVMAAFMTTESQLSLVTLSFLYLFVRA